MLRANRVDKPLPGDQINPMAIGEFELIKRYFHRQLPSPGVVVGIGDDCALLTLPPGHQLAVSMDTLVEGVHFPSGAAPDLIAERALRVNLSDLAAMGAEPLWFTLGLTLTEASPQWLQAFSEGLFRVAEEFGIALVGGDTTRGPLTITIQVHGSVPQGEALLRSGARPGDRIFVTGSLGGGGASLALIRGKIAPREDDRVFLHDCYYRPEPHLQFGQRLRGLASAAIDISDGLMADLGHICQRSGVGARVISSQLPVEQSVARYFSEAQAIDFALSGGDDYRLCFTVPPERIDALRALQQAGSLSAIEIGEITTDTQVLCVNDQEEVLESKGFQHFEPND